MADWGPFLQGLSHTTQQLPNIIQRAQALKQEEELKQDALAQQRFQYGITLMGQFKNRPEQQAYIFNNFVRPALDRGKQRGIITHDVPEMTADMFGNDIVSKTMEELDGWTRLYQKGLDDSKKTGATTNALPVSVYYQKINDTIGNALKKVTDESDIKRIQDMGARMKSESAPMLYGQVPDEEKQIVASHMTKEAQKAYGVGDKADKLQAPAPRSFTGPGGKTMRVNQVFDPVKGEYRDVGTPWEYKDPAAVVKVTTEARGGQGEMTDDAITLAANQYIKTGQMPPLGMGSMGARAKILNKAAEIVRVSGINPEDVPAFAAEYKALQGALRKAETGYASFAGFEQGMLKNMEYALSISKKYGRTQLPPANTMINALRQKTGDPQIVELTNAVYAAAMEYEKIRTAGSDITSAELSVNAQKKAEELINTAQTHAQLEAAAKAMRTDAKNIITARKGQIDSLKKQLKGVGTADKKKDPKNMSNEELLKALGAQ